MPPVIRTALACAWPHRRVLGLAVACLLAGRAATLALPWLGGRLAGSLFDAEAAVDSISLAGWLGAGLGLFALQAALAFAGGYLALRGGELAITELRARLYERLQSRRLDFFHRQRAGEIVSLFGVEVETVSYYVTDTLLAAVPTALAAAAALALITGYDPVIGACALASIPLFLIASHLLGRRIHARTRHLNAEQAVATGIVQENLALLPAIKAYRRERFEARRYRGQLDRVLDAMLRQQWSYLGMGAVASFLAGALSLGLVALGAWRVSAGALAPGDLIALVLYGYVLVRPLGDLAGLVRQTRQATGAAARLQRAFDAAAEEDDGDAAVALPDGPGALELRDLRFGYGDAAVLDGASLSVRAGETVAIVGANGAGKTTLAHLLLRFYAPDAGSIELDGVDVARVSLAELRRAVALVPQVDLLARGTIRDNIAFGREDATDEQIRRAAAAAGAHAFIAALPDGYDTAIGERGVTLSGGQRQRISLARALLREPRVLVLDEATAMFDPDSERQLVRDCRALFASRTVVLITHRPALLAVADRVVRLERGQLVDALPPAAAARAAGGARR